VIWLAGARGMLGRDVASELQRHGMPFVSSDTDCDVTDPTAVEDFARGRKLDWIINCSGYTAVDKAEDDQERAGRVNAEGPQNLGRLAAARGSRILHLSTDYVFDGTASLPYREEDRVGPRGAYARTKERGERLLRQAAAEHVIIRTAWLYGIHGGSFVATMLRLMKEREELAVVDDQRGTPTYTRDLAAAIVKVVASREPAFGTYHYTNEGETTWYGFARAIAHAAWARGLLSRPCRVKPIRTDQYPTRAPRPAYSVLSKEKIRLTHGIAIPTWQDALSRYLDEVQRERALNVATQSPASFIEVPHAGSQ